MTIDPGNIGGPSAGLAFTLGVIDELNPGDLTGGRKIAATGTIESDGSVGDVGGVVQKTAAVRRAGAIAFLVPPGEYADAVKNAGPKLKVIKVTSLEQALDALKGLGRRPERPAAGADDVAGRRPARRSVTVVRYRPTLRLWPPKVHVRVPAGRRCLPTWSPNEGSPPPAGASTRGR